MLTLALQTLPVESVEERAAVVAPRQALVALGCESVGNVDLEPDLCVGLRGGKRENRFRIKMLKHYLNSSYHPHTSSERNTQSALLFYLSTYCGAGGHGLGWIDIS